MPDEIPPVLTSAEWRDLAAGPHPDYPAAVTKMAAGRFAFARIAALANAALPDDSPHKLTRADLEGLRDAADRLTRGAPRLGDLAAAGACTHVARVLAALLPPDDA